jgi:hypothetical protein
MTGRFVLNILRQSVGYDTNAQPNSLLFKSLPTSDLISASTCRRYDRLDVIHEI